MIEIPEWSNTVEAVENGTASPLDLFIYHNEPAGNPQDAEFRDQLQALLDYVSGLTPRALDVACRECGKVYSHYTGCSLAIELPRKTPRQ